MKTAKIPTLKRTKRGYAYARFNGRQQWFGRYDDPAAHQAFQEHLQRWLANGGEDPDAELGDLTVADLVARFLLHAERYYRRADGTPTQTVEAFVYAFRPLMQLFASTRAEDFSLQCLKLVRERMLDDALARKTVNIRVSRLVQLFKWGAEEELVSASTYQGLTVLRNLQAGRSRARETEKRRPVSRADVDAVLPHASRQIAAIVELMWWSGMRSGEAVAMRPRDLERSGEVWFYRLDHHKAAHHGHVRRVAIGPHAQEILRPFLDRVPRPDDSLPLFSPREAEDERNAARRRRQGSRRRRADLRDAYGVPELRRAVQRACDQAGIDRWTPHQLRHAAGTRLREEAGLEASQLILGHRNANTTEIYAEVSERRRVEFALRFG
ncbi:tyrosine-type recombinase/integrase [Engelhardtia mirabilis]|uniref:Tyrosine recombinase XerC n=1 Tax=Engelhardtia mirabilis TaxID=2528011 RepID=A0A518BH58_9BACT|nr:Tyrosine recombinase XerC [Planctomycetes bacterium Pla133]QDV00645.1 Tyrosine recombinase XerC [Planctomycetes bacterium Pla86]